METQGQRIKKIRQALNLSQEDFGKIIDTMKQNVSRLENDKMVLNNDKLIKLAVEYKVSPNYILLGIGEMFLYKNAASEYENIKKDILSEVKIMLVNHNLIDDD